MHSPEKSAFSRNLPRVAAALPLALVASLPMQAQTAEKPAAAPAGEEVVVLSPFTVSDRQTQGYQATNSIGGTRSNTPIKDIPLNIQVFTKDLAQDINATTQMDLERYNAAMVNGGADAKSSNTIQQPYNAFLFRGFVQNWGTRDGIRQYDPVDMQGIARVEVVKGPAAPLYGLAYPGGIMNSITKEVDFTGNSTTIGASIQSFGEWRATIDANFVGEVATGGKFGVRVNAARSNTGDQREHSKGMVKYTQINFAWQPLKDTEIKFLVEDGYREKPNGLGYFIKYKSNGNGVKDVGVGVIGTERPLQADPLYAGKIPWDWNWADSHNMRTIDTTLRRATFVQSIGDDFTVTGYLQYATRNNIDSQGWDAGNNAGANGTGGSAAAWDMGWANSSLGGVGTGWITDSATGQEVIRKAYHFRNWANTMHGYGVTALYKYNFGGIRNVFTVGGNAWAEEFHSVKGTTRADSKQVIDFPIATGIDTSLVPLDPGTDYYIDIGATGAENNSNDYYFASWQMYALNDRLKLNAAVNRTNIKNVQHTSPENLTKLSKTSPMFGAMFDITKDISIFAVHSSSVFPTTDKDSYWRQMPPTVGKSNEIGLKTDLFGGKISGTVSYYKINQTGGVQDDPDAINKNAANGVVGDKVPGGKQSSQGFEADLVFQPTPEWQILLSYAHNDQKIKTSTNKYTIGMPSTSGHIKDQIAVLTKYTFMKGTLNGLSIGMGAQYAGKALMAYNNNPTATFSSSDPTLVPLYRQYNPSTFYMEAFATYKFKAWGGYQHRIQLNAKNLTKVPEYIGWFGEAGDTYATHRYEAPSSVTWTLGYSIEF